MGTLYLVRHGQASFGEADYDNLSALGHQQSARLGEYFAERGVRFDALITGTLRRHQQTLAGILSGLGQSGETLAWEGLNEYDGTAVIATVHPEPLQRPETPEMVKNHFRILRHGLQQWMAGTVHPQGMPSYAEFADGVRNALDEVRTRYYGGRVLVVSSGGPISTAVGQVLAAPAESTIELNMRIRNTSLTEFAFTPKRHALLGFNAIPHLDAAPFRDWVTYT